MHVMLLWKSLLDHLVYTITEIRWRQLEPGKQGVCDFARSVGRQISLNDLRPTMVVGHRLVFRRDHRFSDRRIFVRWSEGQRSEAVLCDLRRLIRQLRSIFHHHHRLPGLARGKIFSLPTEYYHQSSFKHDYPYTFPLLVIVTLISFITNILYSSLQSWRYLRRSANYSLSSRVSYSDVINGNCDCFRVFFGILTKRMISADNSFLTT